MVLFRRWRRRKAVSEVGLDERTRDANETYRAQHDGLLHPAQPAADRWQRQTDDAFRPPSHPGT